MSLDSTTYRFQKRAHFRGTDYWRVMIRFDETGKWTAKTRELRSEYKRVISRGLDAAKMREVSSDLMRELTTDERAEC